MTAAEKRAVFDISIHAPTRGATFTIPTGYIVIAFQSTLPREERRSSSAIMTERMKYFNPRSHERSDMGLEAVEEKWKFQSTLPREERHKRLPERVLFLIHFNPRSHERSDNNGASCGAYVYLFQSTLPREERR